MQISTQGIKVNVHYLSGQDASCDIPLQGRTGITVK